MFRMNDRLRLKYRVHGEKPKARKVPRGNGNNKPKRIGPKGFGGVGDKNLSKDWFLVNRKGRYDPTDMRWAKHVQAGRAA